MFGSKKNTPRLDEAEARIAGLVKLAGQHEELHQRLASAIDELEKRQANALVVINAAFSGLQRTVAASHADTVEMATTVQAALNEVSQLLAATPPAEASPTPGLAAEIEPPAVSPQPGVGAPSNVSAIGRFTDRAIVRMDGAAEPMASPS
jgi:hypothetical protein